MSRYPLIESFTPTDKLRDSFMSRFEQDSNGCWIWNSGRYPKGYGRFYVGKVSWYAHRAAFLLLVGPIPDGLFVLHKCDVRLCVNPEHLYAGTAAENTMDAVNRGRLARGDRAPVRLHPSSVQRGGQHWTRRNPEKIARGDRSGSSLHPERVARGEKHGNAKLTSRIVEEIRNINGMSQYEIAKQYAISQSTVGAILRREAWNV